MISLTASRAVWLSVLVLLAAAPLAMSGTYYQFMLILVFIHAVVAIGLNILAGYGGLFSLGHAALMAMGAYTSALVSKGLEAVPTLAASGFHVWLGMVAGVIVASVFGALLAFPSLRLKGPYLAMVTIAFGWVIWKVLLEWVDVTGGELGITAIPKARMGPLVLTTSYFYYFALAVVVLAMVFQRNLIQSAYGRRLLAIKHSEIAAASVGINVYAVKVRIFVISAAFAGVGGALFAHQQNFVNPDNFQFFSSVFFLLAVLFGGAGTLVGPVIGATVLTLLPELLHGFDRIRLIVYGLFILATLYFQPNGVAGFLRRRVTTLPGLSRETMPTEEVSAFPMGHAPSVKADSLIEVRSLTKAFGGPDGPQGHFAFPLSWRGTCRHRTEWRRQDNVDQFAFGLLQAGFRRDPLRRQPGRDPFDARSRRDGHCPDLPDHQALRGNDGYRECHGRVRAPLQSQTMGFGRKNSAWTPGRRP